MGGPGSGRRKAAETVARTMESQAETQLVDTPPVAPSATELKDVTQPTGSPLRVQGEGEQSFYNAQRDKYLEEFKFDAISDLADLDALLMHELLDFRYSTQLSSGRSYEGLFLTYAAEEQLRQNKIAEAKVIGEIKKNLGLSRTARDAQKGTTAEYLTQLRIRAREFGIHRNTQVTRALALMNELSSIVGTYDRSNDFERAKTGFESEAEILTWVREEMIPKFHDVDAEFRANGQKNWVGTI